MSEIFGNRWFVQALASALLHSLWQGALIAALAAIGLRFAKTAAPSVRYVIACAGLLLMLACWGATFMRHVSQDRNTPPLTNATAAIGLDHAPTRPDASAAAITSTVVDGTQSAAPLRWLQELRPRLNAWAIELVPAWLIGVCVLSVRLWFGWSHVRRLRRRAIHRLPEPVLERSRRLAQAMRISRPVELVQSARAHVPAVVGALRPIVFLPASALTGLTPAQLDAVIAHELAHIRRHDYLVNLLQSAIEVLLFYHPACWWLSRRIRDEREQCCDDIAVQACGDCLTYATALAVLETQRIDQPALSLAATDGPLLRRIRRLIAPRTVAHTVSSNWMTAAIPLAAVCLLVVTAGATSIATAQTATPSAGRAIPHDKGILEGHILDATSGRGIPNATIEVVGIGAAARATTAGDGGYSIEGLAPREYRIFATAPGYIKNAYRGRDRDDLGVPVAISGGRATEGIDLMLQGAGAVSGRVLDAQGDGLQGVEIELVTERTIGGSRRPVAVAFAQTEDRGEYRFGEVLPGDYWIRAYRSSYSSPSRRSPSDRARAALEQHACATLPEACSVTDRTTFYPGVPHVEEAQLLHLDAGEELFGNDFTLLKAATHEVAGRVVSPARDYSDVEVHLIAKGGSRNSGEYTAHPNAAGRFAVPGVAPGSYMVAVFSMKQPATWTGSTQDITVDEADVTDLAIVGHAGAHVDGRIVASANATSKLNPAGVHVTFEVRSDEGGMHMSGGAPSAANGSFSADAPSGPVRISVDRVPAGWMLQTIVVDGIDAGDKPVVLGEGAHSDVDVVLTDRITHLLGRVIDSKGRGIGGASVLVFADDPSQWTVTPASVRAVRASDDGSFSMESLPPADYLAADASRVATSDQFDPTVLQQLSRTATRFRILEGEQRSIRVAGDRR